MGLQLKWALAIALVISGCAGEGVEDSPATSTAPPSVSTSVTLESTAAAASTTASTSEPTEPDAKKAACAIDDATVVDRGETLFAMFSQTSAGCAFCHDVDAAPLFTRFGDEVRGSGPALLGVMDRHSEGYVRAQILDGGGLMEGRGNYVDHESIDELGCSELDHLIAYLYSLEPGDLLMTDAELAYEPNEAERGAALFELHCEICHSDGGRIKGEGHPFSPQPPELTHVFRRHSRGLAVEMITRGKGNMPSYREQLSNEDINALVAYLKRLAEE